MKRLTLIRHGKSSWDDASLGDFDRPLNTRGLRDAPLMGERLALEGLTPELILTSPACRTFDTAQLMAHKVSYPAEQIHSEKHLYLGSVADITAVLHLQDNHVDHIWLVGHNPDLKDFINQFADRPIPKFPTAGVCSLTFDENSWQRLSPGSGRRTFYDTPKRKGLD